jgi:small subunit ribosomal protein S4
VVYRLGFASSPAQARQLVCHGHFQVNGHKVDIPSSLIKTGDKVSLSEKSKKIPLFKDSLETVARRGLPVWLELDKDSFVGTVKELPTRDILPPTINEQLIVELYSK